MREGNSGTTRVLSDREIEEVSGGMRLRQADYNNIMVGDQRGFNNRMTGPLRSGYVYA